MDQERLSAIWARTVEKLQEVVREFRITEDELHEAGRYFDRLGQAGMCRSLIDVGLAMTSVDTVARTEGGTRPNLEGPYYAAHPIRADGNLIDREPPPDVPRLRLFGTVRYARTGEPIAGARLDFWQADAEGIYDRKGSHLRGVVITDAEGGYRITTLVPNDYSEHDQDPIGELFRAMGRTNTRAAHIHVKVSVDGELLLTTQLFMPTSQFLERDYVEGAVSDDLTIKIEPEAGAPGGAELYRAKFDLAVAPRRRSTAA
jgi:catechol 1,2-dioxygenase